MSKKIFMSLSQIFILVFGIISIGYILGSEIKIIGAEETEGFEIKIGPILRQKEGLKLLIDTDIVIQKNKYKYIIAHKCTPDESINCEVGFDAPSPNENGGTAEIGVPGIWAEPESNYAKEYKKSQWQSIPKTTQAIIIDEDSGKIIDLIGSKESETEKESATVRRNTPLKTCKDYCIEDFERKTGECIAPNSYMIKYYDELPSDYYDITNPCSEGSKCYCSRESLEEIKETPETNKLTDTFIPTDLAEGYTWARKFKAKVNYTTVKIGPTGDVAIWQLDSNGRTWTCIDNCVIKKSLVDPNAQCPPSGDCKGQSKNLCTHYIKNYLITNSNPKGNCDEGYFQIGESSGTKSGDEDEKKEINYYECAVGTEITTSDGKGWRYTQSGTWYNYENKGVSQTEDRLTGNRLCQRYNNNIKSTKGKCTSGTFLCVGGFSKDKEDEKKEDEKEKTATEKKYKEAPILGGTKWYSYLAGHIIEGAIWGAGLLAASAAIKSFIPEEHHNLLDEYSGAFFGAILSGKAATGALEAAFPALRAAETGKEGLTISGAGWVGIGVGALYFALAFRHKEYEVISFSCQPWDSPTGGQNCDACNKQGILPCSEYQCRSLGQSCELINKGTEEERCAWINRGDVEYPRIEAWEEALINEDYVYTPDNAISPPDRGVIIEYTPSTTGRIPRFSPLSFGIKLTNEDDEPEPAKCKLDLERKESFEEMDYWFSDGLLLEEHSYSLSLPGEGGELELENEGEYNIYIKCQDANGNYNPANFVFKFEVEQGPDTTPPLITATSIASGMPIAFNQTSIDLEVYVNEPVEGCRWAHSNQEYAVMEGEMDCTRGNNLNDMNSRGLYTCETTLDGLKDRQENNFYFRCEDLSGNINRESYEFMLMGTQPLVLDWTKPEEGATIKDSTENIKVTLEAQTSAGYKEGESNCYFSDTGEEGDYIMFLNTGSYQHSQDLWLPQGDYEYYIRCVDLGGNMDNDTISFTVESDSSAPRIIRAYHEETYLKIITNEPARCVYDTTYENYPCDYSFDDGTSMTTLEEANHYTEWNPQTTFYIRCQDEYGTQPDPDECSIIVRPSDIR